MSAETSIVTSSIVVPCKSISWSYLICLERNSYNITVIKTTLIHKEQILYFGNELTEDGRKSVEVRDVVLIDYS